MADPLAAVTRAVSLPAPVEQVWPWIAQMGSSALGRAGWYSYDRLDNGGVRSADHVRDDVPAPRVGDVLVPDPAFAWTVRQVEPGDHLVLELSSPPGWFTVRTYWTLAVRPSPDGTTRLIERSGWDMRPRLIGVPFSLVFEVIDFVMMRRHLLDIRERVSRHARAVQPQLIHAS